MESLGVCPSLSQPTPGGNRIFQIFERFSAIAALVQSSDCLSNSASITKNKSMKISKQSLRAITIISSLACFGVSAGADSVAVHPDFTGQSYGTSQNSQSVGWGFTVNTSISVTMLAIFDHRGDGLIDSHRVGVWDSGGTLIVEATVPSGTSANLLDGFRYVGINQQPLTPGDYVIGAYYNSQSQDLLPGSATTLVEDPAILFAGARYGLGGNLPFPNVFQGGNNHFGPNFQFKPSPVPDQSSPALLLAGVMSLFITLRIRNMLASQN